MSSPGFGEIRLDLHMFCISVRYVFPKGMEFFLKYHMYTQISIFLSNVDDRNFFIWFRDEVAGQICYRMTTVHCQVFLLPDCPDQEFAMWIYVYIYIYIYVYIFFKIGYLILSIFLLCFKFFSFLSASLFPDCPSFLLTVLLASFRYLTELSLQKTPYTLLYWHCTHHTEYCKVL